MASLPLLSRFAASPGINSLTSYSTTSHITTWRKTYFQEAKVSSSSIIKVSSGAERHRCPMTFCWRCKRRAALSRWPSGPVKAGRMIKFVSVLSRVTGWWLRIAVPLPLTNQMRSSLVEYFWQSVRLYRQEEESRPPPTMPHFSNNTP